MERYTTTACKPPSQAVHEEQQQIIEVRVVQNDRTRESLRLLTLLKAIFQAQLPKMPREYIAKLVYDPMHVSLCVVKRRCTRSRGNAALVGPSAAAQEQPCTLLTAPPLPDDAPPEDPRDPSAGIE